mgnify:CR=1 FL=1
MKKLFTLLVVLFAAVTYANAGDWTKSWNISDLDVQEITETKDFNGLTVVAKADTTIAIDENSKTADGISFTKRMKLGGVGSPTVRHLKFDVAGPAKIKIFRLSSSSSSDSAAEESLMALYNFMKPGSLKEQKREGLILHNLDEDCKGNTTNYIKLMAEAIYIKEVYNERKSSKRSEG